MMREARVVAICALLGACGGGDKPPPPPPPPPDPVTIPDVTAYLAQSICADGTPTVLQPGCGAHQQTSADPMPWRRWDWAHADGLQVEDAYRRGEGFINSFSYPPHGPFVPANGDGGDLLVVDGPTVRIDYTQNGDGHGGTLAGWWVGPKCGGTGWLEFDNKAPSGRWRSAVATLKGSFDANACPPLDAAFTRWRREIADIQITVEGTAQVVTLPVVISEHYAGTSIASSSLMERVIMAEGVGRVLWEAWSRAPAGFTTGCIGIAPWSDAPEPGWGLQDRRCLTAYRRTDGTMTGDLYGWP